MHLRSFRIIIDILNLRVKFLKLLVFGTLLTVLGRCDGSTSILSHFVLKFKFILQIKS